MSGRGVLTGIVSIPCRYIHSPVSLMAVSDFEATVALMQAALAQVNTVKL